MEPLTLNHLTEIVTNKSSFSLPKSNIKQRKIQAGLILLASDLIMLSISVIFSLLLREIFWPGEVSVAVYVPLLPLLFVLFPITYFIRGLYPGFGMDVIEELRTLTYTTTAVYAVLATLTFLVKIDWDYSRLAFVMSWAISLLTLPLGRAYVKNKYGNKKWWGIPVIIIGAGKAGENVINSLLKHYQIGLKPLVAVDDDSNRWGYINNIPVVGGLDIIPDLADKLKIGDAIIAMPSVSRKRQHEIIKNYSKYFQNTTYIPDIFGLNSLWVNSRDLGGILGLEVQQKLLKRSSRIQKRIFDITIAGMLMLFLMPVVAILSVLVFIDSKGRVLFHQERMGKDDTRFDIIKFRTMFEDAEDRLSDLLTSNKDFRSEYEKYHKLRNDPRLTRTGKILRKFSLDELPQFINVIKGEMSLIGPRAYIPWEKVKMNGYEEMILKVKPGISGLWQVTDRNESSFEERNETDVYYIRNWSMFLDIYIVARTIGVILLGKGA